MRQAGRRLPQAPRRACPSRGRTHARTWGGPMRRPAPPKRLHAPDRVALPRRPWLMRVPGVRPGADRCADRRSHVPPTVRALACLTGPESGVDRGGPTRPPRQPLAPDWADPGAHRGGTTCPTGADSGADRGGYHLRTGADLRSDQGAPMCRTAVSVADRAGLRAPDRDGPARRPGGGHTRRPRPAQAPDRSALTHRSRLTHVRDRPDPRPGRGVSTGRPTMPDRDGTTGLRGGLTRPLAGPTPDR